MSKHSNCKIITLANQKGGTAKTTTTYNLGYILAQKGKDVLLVDFDSQANLTRSCGIEQPDKLEISISEVLLAVMDEGGVPPKDDFIFTAKTRLDADGTNKGTAKGQDKDKDKDKDPDCGKWGKLDILPCNIKLAVMDMQLVNAMSREYLLKTILDPFRDDYDYIIIDTSPSLGLLTINALTACDEVLIPTSPQLWSVEGLAELLTTVSKVKKHLNPSISIRGILLTICKEKTNLYRESRKLIEEEFGENLMIFETIIPDLTKVGEANFERKSIVEYLPTSKASMAYVSFADEFLKSEVN